jgi:hypothetical protein
MYTGFDAGSSVYFGANFNENDHHLYIVGGSLLFEVNDHAISYSGEYRGFVYVRDFSDLSDNKHECTHTLTVGGFGEFTHSYANYPMETYNIESTDVKWSYNFAYDRHLSYSVL